MFSRFQAHYQAILVSTWDLGVYLYSVITCSSIVRVRIWRNWYWL